MIDSPPVDPSAFPVISLPSGSGIVASTDTAAVEHDMIRTDEYPLAIFASDGTTIQRLYACASSDGSLKLLDDAHHVVAPWEVVLVRWPSALEAALRHNGYLPNRPSDTELWCNCAD